MDAFRYLEAGAVALALGLLLSIVYAFIDRRRKDALLQKRPDIQSRLEQLTELLTKAEGLLNVIHKEIRTYRLYSEQYMQEATDSEEHLIYARRALMEIAQAETRLEGRAVLRSGFGIGLLFFLTGVTTAIASIILVDRLPI